MCGRRGLEKYVKGYRQIRNDLEKKREELATNQNPAQYHLRENLIKVEFYKPVVASRWVEVYQLRQIFNNFLSERENLEDFTAPTLWEEWDSFCITES